MDISSPPLRIASSLAFLLLCAATSHAADTAAQLAACAQISVERERLACFDRLTTTSDGADTAPQAGTSNDTDTSTHSATSPSGDAPSEVAATPGAGAGPAAASAGAAAGGAATYPDAASERRSAATAGDEGASGSTNAGDTAAARELSDDAGKERPEYVATVTACTVSEIERRATFYLASGQVWRQVNASNKSRRFRNEDCSFEVTIRRDMFGWVMTVAGEKRGLRVKRID